jgi:hypothetical protein
LVVLTSDRGLCGAFNSNIIKFADRLHNLRTLEFVREDKRQRIALESIEVYAPLANRLGMGKLKGELEDAAFPYAYPEEYSKIEEIIKEKKDLLKQEQEQLESVDIYNKFMFNAIKKAQEEMINTGHTLVFLNFYDDIFKKCQNFKVIHYGELPVNCCIEKNWNSRTINPIYKGLFKEIQKKMWEKNFYLLDTTNIADINKYKGISILLSINKPPFYDITDKLPHGYNKLD